MEAVRVGMIFSWHRKRLSFGTRRDNRFLIRTGNATTAANTDTLITALLGQWAFVWRMPIRSPWVLTTPGATAFYGDCLGEALGVKEGNIRIWGTPSQVRTWDLR